jgi:hypothetical protein
MNGDGHMDVIGSDLRRQASLYFKTTAMEALQAKS